MWSALTYSDMLAKWIWKNDFKRVIGHKFEFRASENEWWNGIVDSEVLVVDEPNKLSYTWISAGESTTVTWTLKEGSEGILIYISIKLGLVKNKSSQGSYRGS